MKTNTKWLIGVVVVVALGTVTYLTTNTDLFKGSLRRVPASERRVPASERRVPASERRELQTTDVQSATPPSPKFDFQTLCEKLEWGKWNVSACEINGKIATNETELKEVAKEIFKNGCEDGGGTWTIADGECSMPNGQKLKFDDFWGPFIKGELEPKITIIKTRPVR